MPIRSSGVQRRRRVGRDLTIAALGLLLGVGGAFAVRSLTQTRPEPSASQLALPGPTPAAAPAGPAGAAATSLPPTAPVRPGSARAALAAFLAAHARGDFAGAYRLLDQAGRERFPSVVDWIAEQDDRLQPTAFRVGAERPAGGGAADVRASVLHRAGVDPFSGLTPGRTDELWRVHRERGAWRVGSEPLEQVPVLPSDRLAPAAVQAWLERLVACDQAGAARLESGGDRYGPAGLAELPCRERGRWSAGAATGLDQATDASAYVAAFGPDVQDWGRLVPVRKERTRFNVVVAPVGDGWRVLGTDPAQPAG